MSKAFKKQPDTAKMYRECLQPVERERYLRKIEIIGEDPYEVADLSPDWSLLPKVTYPDIVNYLLFTPSPYTSEDLKSYKGLEAYNQMVSGWVRDVQSKEIKGKCLVRAKVGPHYTWIILRIGVRSNECC